MKLDQGDSLAYMKNILFHWHTKCMEKDNPYIPIVNQFLGKYQIDTSEHMYCFESDRMKIHKLDTKHLKYILYNAKYKVSNN